MAPRLGRGGAGGAAHATRTRDGDGDRLRLALRSHLWAALGHPERLPAALVLQRHPREARKGRDDDAVDEGRRAAHSTGGRRARGSTRECALRLSRVFRGRREGAMRAVRLRGARQTADHRGLTREEEEAHGSRQNLRGRPTQIFSYPRRRGGRYHWRIATTRGGNNSEKQIRKPAAEMMMCSRRSRSRPVSRHTSRRDSRHTSRHDRPPRNVARRARVHPSRGWTPVIDLRDPLRIWRSASLTTETRDSLRTAPWRPRSPTRRPPR